MAQNFVVSNGQISRPVHIPGITPDVDLNGICWSNQIGMFYYEDPSAYVPINPPNGIPPQGFVPGRYGIGN